MKVRSLLERVAESSETAALRVGCRTQILSLGWHLGLSDDELEQTFAEGCGLAEASGDLRSLGGLYRAYALSMLIAGSVDESATWFEKAVQLADKTDDLAMRAVASPVLVLIVYISSS